MHIATIVVGTAANDFWIVNQADNEGQTYQQNTNSGGIWSGHIVADDGSPGNRLDGNGYLRCFDLVNINTGATATRYRNNSNVFASGINVAQGIKGLDADGSIYVDFGARIFKCSPTYTIPVPYFDPTDSNAGNGLAFDSNGDMWGYNTTSNKPVKMTAIDYVAHTCTQTDATVGAGTFDKWGRNAGGITGRLYYSKGGTIRYIQPGNLAAGATDVITDAVTSLVFVIGDDGNIYYARGISGGSVTVIVKADKDGAALATCSITDAAQQVPQVYEGGNIWVGGSTATAKFTRINTATMAVSLTLATPPADWLFLSGVAAPGSPAIYGVGAAFSAGQLGLLAPEAGLRRSAVVVHARRLRSKRRPLSTRLGKVFGGPTPPPTPDDKGPRCLLALRFNEKWFFASQGKNLTIVAGGFQNGTPAIFGTDGQNIWQLFSAPDHAIKTRVQTAYWPMRKPTHMKEGLKAGVEVTTPSSPNVLNLMLDSDFGSIAAQFSTSNAVVWVNKFDVIIPWVNFLGDIIPFGASGFIIYQGDAGFKGRYLGYTLESTSPGYAINGFLCAFQQSTPWAVKAQT